MTKKLRRILSVFLACIMLTALPSCNKENNTDKSTSGVTSEQTIPEINSKADFAKAWISNYRLVYSDNDYSEETVNSILSLRIKLRKTFQGSEFTINKYGNGTNVEEVEKELLVGITNRKESIELLSSLPDNCFGIEVTNDKIAITAKTARLLCDAIKYFEENYIKPDSEGNLALEKIKYISEPIEYKVSSLISNEEGFTTTHTLLYDIPPADECKIMQGGCSDGEYMYYCMITPGGVDQKCRIYKYSLSSNKLVKMSEILELDHANDVTYNDKTNELYVSHCSPNAHKLSVIDPTTLEYKREIKLNMFTYAVAYQPERNVYVCPVGGSERIAVLDENFKLDRSYIKSGNSFPATESGYTKQGVVCDYDYIYAVLYKENIIKIYDWEGNFINLIPLSIPNSVEPENLSIVDDTLYIACNNSTWTGGQVYKVNIIPPKK